MRRATPKTVEFPRFGNGSGLRGPPESVILLPISWGERLHEKMKENRGDSVSGASAGSAGFQTAMPGEMGLVRMRMGKPGRKAHEFRKNPWQASRCFEPEPVLRHPIPAHSGLDQIHTRLAGKRIQDRTVLCSTGAERKTPRACVIGDPGVRIDVKMWGNLAKWLSLRPGIRAVLYPCLEARNPGATDRGGKLSRQRPKSVYQLLWRFS